MNAEARRLLAQRGAVRTDVRLSVAVGLAFGAIQVLSPFAFRWLPAATVQSILLAMIAAIYIGFAVADGRPKVLVVEVVVASGFVTLAAVSVVGPVWLLVLGYGLHGLKDLWQARTTFVAGTRWWPPFCAAVDWVVAASLLVAAVARLDLHA
jgi:hypothetical protein